MRLLQWPCVGFGTGRGAGIIGVAHFHTHYRPTLLILGAVTKPYCTQQIISLAGGSVQARPANTRTHSAASESPTLCSGCLVATGCSNGSVRAKWHGENDDGDTQVCQGFKKWINTIFDSVCSSRLPRLRCDIWDKKKSRVEKKNGHPRDHISPDAISFWNADMTFQRASEKVGRKRKS